MPDSTAIDRLVQQATATFGEQLVSIYAHGTGFAKGPRGVAARLLILVERLDQALIIDAAGLARLARELKLGIRLDSPEHLQRSADVFPVFLLNLMETKQLLYGRDVLADLEVDRQHLRLNLEHSLRTIHRDLLQGFLDARGGQELASGLRGQARRLVFMLEGVLIVSDHPKPAQPEPETILQALQEQELLDAGQRAVFDRLMRLARFEDTLEYGQLQGLYADLLVALEGLIDHVDRLED